MTRELRIGPALIDDAADCYVIAEIGHNHQGELERAKALFRAAKECGVDAVKLQKRDNRSLYTRALYDSPYESEQSFGPTYGAHREALELGRDAYRALQDYAQKLGLEMFATAFDLPSADFLAELGMPAYKIASGDLTNTVLIRHVASLGKPVLISTGGGTLADVERAFATARGLNEQVCLLQCTASYPTEPQDMHLRVITTFRERFPDTVIGLSDHQSGISLALVAYVLGARVVEKHFTINRSWKGTDHAFSLEPVGMRKLVRDVRRAREAMGDGVKRPLPCEAKPLYKMSKKLVAARPLPAGRVLAAGDVAIKSPGDGLPPYRLERVLGRRTLRALDTDDEITFELLENGDGA